MTYRLRGAPSSYIEDDWSETLQQQQQQLSADATMNRRKYIDPWDLENFEYIQRTVMPPSSPEMHILTPSPAGEPIASTFYYVSGGNDEEINQNHHHHSLRQRQQFEDDFIDMDTMGMMLMDGSAGNGSGSSERFDYTTGGCYAGLDEELFYNAKYESIHDEPPYSMYYTDIESSNERTSSCDSSSSVSTLQLHTPGFGVRASGRRSIVLPKPEPQIEFPPPPQEFNTAVEVDYPKYQPPSCQLRQLQASPGAVEADDTTPPTTMMVAHHGDDVHLPYCSLSNCYECVPEHVPVYAISPGPATLMRRRMSASGGGGSLAIGGNVGIGMAVPPNNFGLSKRGLLQIDYSFNWNNLYRFISNGH